MINTPSTLRSVRRSHNLTLADLGQAVGLSAAQLSAKELAEQTGIPKSAFRPDIWDAA